MTGFGAEETSSKITEGPRKVISGAGETSSGTIGAPWMVMLDISSSMFAIDTTGLQK